MQRRYQLRTASVSSQLCCGLTAMVMLVMGSMLEAAEEVAGETVQADNESVYRFSSPPRDRRDIFHSVIEIITVERRIDQMQQEAAARADVPLEREPRPAVPTGEMDAQALAERDVDELVLRIRELFNAEQWDNVLRLIDRRVEQVEHHVANHPDSRALDINLNRIRNFRLQAQERKDYEEARQQFLALGIVVEGIIWDADGESMVLIKNEPRALGMNQRVRGSVITGIDTNRVDFRFSYRRRQYHFQRYIGEDL